MFRTSVLAPLGLFLTLATQTACDTRKSDPKAIAVEANHELAENKRDAAADAARIQAEADTKIAAAQATFAKSREDFRHEVAANLVTLDKDVAALEAKAKTAKGQVKTDLDARLGLIHPQRAAFAEGAKSIETATVATWDTVRAKLARDWTDLKAAVDKA